MNGWMVFMALVIGLLLGALLASFYARRRQSALQAQLTSSAADLSEANAALAAAEAESRLLTSQSSADASVLRALTPVAEQLKSVRDHVAQMERDRSLQFGALAQQLKAAQESDSKLLTTTQSLESALRSTSARGRWGEVQLHRIVESAGLLQHVDYTEQATRTLPDGTVRPDLVVHLPGGKELIVDSKVPLSSYLDAQEATSEAAIVDAYKAHAKAVRAHVDALNSKKYWAASANSPEVVVCFLPAESILATALNADPGLLDYALAHSVVLASPANLLAVLKAVAYAWKQDVLTESAKELFDLSNELYGRLGVLGQSVGKLGSSLKSSVERYNAMVGSLESRVLPTARKLNKLDPEGLQPPPAVEVQPRLVTAPELQLEDGDEEASQRESA